MTVVLTGEDLTLDEVVRVARGRERVELAPEAVERMREARALVERVLERGDAVYGMSTGVGMRKKLRVERDEVEQFNRMLILDHRTGQGPPATSRTRSASAACRRCTGRSATRSRSASGSSRSS